MAKNSITDYSKTASLNTDIQSVDIDEGCLPSGINNAIRELMADLAAMNDGTVTLTSPSFATASLTGNLTFGDNDKAIFGAGSDLQIYHDGSNSYITDSGTGNLKIGGANVEITTAGGTKYFEGAANIAKLYHTGNQKLATTSTGIDVTGTVTADGLTVDGLIKFSGLAPTVDYDFNADSSVTSADGLAYTKMGSGIATAVDISSVDTITPSWSALSGSIYSDNKFRIMSARGNSTDALRIVSSLTAEGHGDTTIIGNVDVDGVDTRLVSGLGISGEDINLVSDSNINFRTAGSTRLDIASNGDISFYEDTGTTAKLFWDASAERLGIGTSSPSQPLHISGIAKADAGFLIGNSYLYEGATDQLNIRVGADGPYVEFIDAGSNVLEFGNSSDALALTSAGSERMRITSTGQVGIGTTSPSQKLHVSGGQMLLNNGSDLYINSSSSVSYLYTVSTPLLFYTNANERMRIDSSGNVLVGTTDTSLYNNGAGGDTGVVIEPSGTIQVAKSSNACVLFNRLDSDGIIAGFRKDGTTVGSIGVEGGDNFYITDNNNTGLNMKSGLIIPCNTDGSTRDNAIDLGASGGRFNDLYLGGGIYVGGTGSANHLDDYEEGTWTPTNAGATLTVSSAKYTKIGRLVNVSCLVTANANTSGDWGGLPFTMDVNGIYSGSVGYQNDTAGETWNVLADSGTSWTMRKGATSEQLASGKNMRMSLTYYTT